MIQNSTDVECCLLPLLIKHDIEVDNMWIIGSALNDCQSASDLDAIICLGPTVYDLASAAEKLRALKRKFLRRYGIPLHLTVFCSSERRELKDFCLGWENEFKYGLVAKESANG